MSFCSLIKGITQTICTLCFCPTKWRSSEPFVFLDFVCLFVFFFPKFEITLYFPVMVMIKVSVFCNEDDDERSDKAITTTAAFKTAVTTRFCKQYHKKRL